MADICIAQRNDPFQSMGPYLIKDWSEESIDELAFYIMEENGGG